MSKAIDAGVAVAEIESSILVDVFARRAEEARQADAVKVARCETARVNGEDLYVVVNKTTGVSHVVAKSDGRRKYTLEPRPAAKLLKDKALLAASARSFRNAAAGEYRVVIRHTYLTRMPTPRSSSCS